MLKLLTIAALLAAGSAHAEPYTCYTADTIQSHVETSDFARVGNLSFRERKSLVGNSMVVEMSYSVVNLTDDALFVDGSFVGIDGGGNIQFALSAAPMLNMVQPQMTDVAKANVFVAPGALKRTVAICVRFEADK